MVTNQNERTFFFDMSQLEKLKSSAGEQRNKTANLTLFNNVVA